MRIAISMDVMMILIEKVVHMYMSRDLNLDVKLYVCVCVFVMCMCMSMCMCMCMYNVYVYVYVYMSVYVYVKFQKQTFCLAQTHTQWDLVQTCTYNGYIHIHTQWTSSKSVHVQ